ncbi:MAG: hypothetical protein QM270_07465 [Bacillota bacterium]|nr:hypothetical protein [Bacillota bacterium]
MKCWKHSRPGQRSTQNFHLLELTLQASPPEMISRSARAFIQLALWREQPKLARMSEWAVETILNTRSLKLLQAALILLDALGLTADQALRAKLAPVLLALANHEAFAPFCLPIISDWPPDERKLTRLIATARTKAFAYSTAFFNRLNASEQRLLLETRLSGDGLLVLFAPTFYRLCQIERRCRRGLDVDLLDSFALLAVNLELQQGDDEDYVDDEDLEAFIAALAQRITEHPDSFTRYDLLQTLSKGMDESDTLDLTEEYLTCERCGETICRELERDNPAYILLALDLEIPVSECILRLWEKDFGRHMDPAGHLAQDCGTDYTLDCIVQFIDLAEIMGPPLETVDLMPSAEALDAWEVHHLLEAFRSEPHSGLPLIEACLQSPHAHVRIEAAELLFCWQHRLIKEGRTLDRARLSTCRRQMLRLSEHPAVSELERLLMLQILTFRPPAG